MKRKMNKTKRKIPLSKQKEKNKNILKLPFLPDKMKIK